MKLLMKILKTPTERSLLVIAFLALVLLVLVEVRCPLLAWIEIDSWLGTVLIKDATKNILSSISSGIFAAYLFYFVVDYLPKSRIEQQATDTLNLVLASVLDAYFRDRIFGHETAIDQIDVSYLQFGVLQAEITKLQVGSPELISKLRNGMHTADSRLPDFRGMIGLAISLSLDHAKQWLVLTDKIRLLAEMTERYEEEVEIMGNNIDKSPLIIKDDLCLRMLEVMEQSQNWLKLCQRS